MGPELLLALFGIFINCVSPRLVNIECGDKLKYTYDYLIAGCGTAGCVVATRLSEDHQNSVLVLEAGGNDAGRPTIESPALRFWIPNNTYWFYETEPQEAILPNEKRTLVETHGKSLGGTSTVNALSYVRGFKSEYDFWESSGATGWSYNDVLPFFLKSEGIRVPGLRNSPFHNTCGPLAVDHPTITETVSVWFNAARELGIPEMDCSHPRPLGICKGQATFSAGRRVSTSSAFLHPAVDRPNLDVLTNALVTKVLISRRKKQAVGLEFLLNGNFYRVRARKEIILSAGAYGSPKILLNSGIGPAAHLRQLKIPVKSDLPVGENLQVQPLIIGNLFIEVPTLNAENFTDSAELVDYVFNRKGLFADKTLVGATLYYQKMTSTDNDLPDFLLVLSENVRFGLEPHSNDTTPTKNRFFILIYLLHPKSRGTVRLRSRVPNDFPKIDPRMLSSQTDLYDYITGIRRLQSFLKAPAFKAVKAQFEPEAFPNCSSIPFDSDEYLKCFIKFKVRSSSGPVGTCKIGNRYDSSSVLDPYLRVKGIGCLRVADASVMPEVAGLPYAPAVMIGERAADLIIKANKHYNERTDH